MTTPETPAPLTESEKHALRRLLRPLVALVVLALIGILFGRVIVSDQGQILGAVCGLLAAGAALYIMKRCEPYLRHRVDLNPELAAKNRLIVRPWLRNSLLAVMSFLFGYAAMAWCGIWVANVMVGTPATREFTVTGWEQPRRRTCEHPEIDQGLRASPFALCAYAGAREQLQPGTRLRIGGPATWFGINVESAGIAGAEAAASPVLPESRWRFSRLPQPFGLIYWSFVLLCFGGLAWIGIGALITLWINRDVDQELLRMEQAERAARAAGKKPQRLDFRAQLKKLDQLANRLSRGKKS